MSITYQQIEAAAERVTWNEVDGAISAVFATFPGQTWTDHSLREVVTVALAGATHLDRRYDVTIEPHHWIPGLHRAYAIDRESDGMDLVAHRVGFGHGRVWERISADVDKLIAKARAAAPEEDWRDVVRREPPAKDSWNYMRLFWASDDGGLDEARLAALDAEGFVGRATPEGYTLEPTDEDCPGVVHFPRND